MIEATSLSSAISTGPALSTKIQGGESFSQTMNNVAADMYNSIKDGEKFSTDALSGQASTGQVVQSVMAAERSLQLALSVRDKCVSAFQEISRMSI